ncbi:MAG: hypothetical protein RLZZ470_1695 [Pseudomonadota bacterium]|jgi:hypothetical protein
MKSKTGWRWVCLCGVGLLSACGLITEQGVYEGVRQQQQIRREPSLPDPQRLPDYDQFKAERDKLQPAAP